MSQDDASRHPRETKGCDSTRCTCQAFGLHRPHSRRSRLIGAAADGYLGELVASLATASTMIKRGTLVVPETLAIGGVSTPWAFTDVWVIPVMYVMVRPVLLAAFTVNWVTRHNEWHAERWKGLQYYTAKYEASTMKTFEQPMKMIVIPMAITYVVSQFLNVCFTHKLVSSRHSPTKRPTKLPVLSKSRCGFEILTRCTPSCCHES